MQGISIQRAADSQDDLALEKKYKSQFFGRIASLFARMIPFMALLDMFTNWLATGNLFNVMVLLLLFLLFLGTIFSILVNRNGNYSFAVNSFLLLGTLSLSVVAVSDTASEISLVYFAIILIIGKPLLTKRALFFLAVLMIIDIFVLEYSGLYSLPVDVYRMAMFIIVTYFVLYIITLFRDDLEEERRYLLEQNQKQLHWIIHQLSATIWTVDRDGQAQLFESNYSRHIMDKGIFDHFMGDETVLAKISTVQQTNLKAEFEFTTDEYTYQVYLDPMYDRNKQSVGCIGMIIDVTEQKLREEYQLKALLEDERLEILKEFLASASHDLRTPLSSLQLSTYLLEKTGISEQQAKYVSRINLASLHFVNALEQMFTLVRLNLEKQDELESYDLVKTLHIMVDTYRDKAKGKYIQIDFSNDAKMVYIDGDKHRIMTALNNVMQNALDHTPDAGTISVHTFNVKQHLMIEIRDSGRGIAPHELSRVKQAFYRVAKHRPGVRVGLGLTISQKIIEQHHGSLDIHSIINVGTYVQILLPLSADKN